MREFILRAFTDDEAETCIRCGLQEVVRCKDCKWRGHEDDSPKWIPCLAIRTNNDWFCADGERESE